MELARWLDVILIPVVFASIFVFVFDERLGDTRLFVRVMAGLFCGLVAGLVFGLVSELIAVTISHHAPDLVSEAITKPISALGYGEDIGLGSKIEILLDVLGVGIGIVLACGLVYGLALGLVYRWFFKE